MKTISSRSRIWLEIPSLDPHDILRASEALGSTNQGFSETTSETVTVSDALAQHIIETTSDTVLLVDSAVAAVEAPTITDQVTLSDAVDGDFQAGAVIDVLTASDSLAGDIVAVAISDALAIAEGHSALLAGSDSSSDVALVSDAVTATWTAETSDAVTASQILLTHDIPAGFADDIAISDIFSGALSASASSQEAVTASDAIGYGFVGDTSDSVTVADVLSGSMAAFVEALSDAISASGALSGGLSVYASLSDIGDVSDGVAGSMALVGVLSDTAIAGDSLRDSAYQVILVTNAETGACSTYTFTPTVNGMVEFAGALYLAAEDGLYALDSSADESGAVTWTLRTGFSNLGSDSLKRIRDVNAQMRSSGNSALHVIATVAGAKVEHHFQVPAIPRTAYREGVTKVGRGIASDYWSFGLQGASPAEIDELRVSADPLSRRR